MLHGATCPARSRGFRPLRASPSLARWSRTSSAASLPCVQKSPFTVIDIYPLWVYSPRVTRRGPTLSEHYHTKHTPRSEGLKRNVTRRLNRAIGQLGGVKAMVEDDRYCGDVLTQLAAAESAIKSVRRLVLQDHLETCVVERVQQGDTEVIDELMQLLKQFS
ncbi:MAG: metal-sensing transcriptional repressor [Atopobiaceae bacterium]|nr:metal-sensing transcriptional repressor [Atopobiaceae bacterium]